MRKILRLFLSLVFISACKSAYIRYDKYTGNMNSIIKELGRKYVMVSYTVNKNYDYISEVEPDYFKYFSDEEKESDVEVYEYKWKKGSINIIVWGKESNGSIIAFNSIEYDKNIKF